MRRWITLVALGGCVACAGDFDEPPVGDSAADSPAITFDVRGPDARRDQGLPPADLRVDQGPPPCSLWSQWSCQEEQELLCTATCGTKLISCTNGGVCQCGAVATGPCDGVFTGSSPCEVCQNALAGGCCAPQVPDGGN